jgi:hypothetical protein
VRDKYRLEINIKKDLRKTVCKDVDWTELNQDSLRNVGVSFRNNTVGLPTEENFRFYKDGWLIDRFG